MTTTALLLVRWLSTDGTLDALSLQAVEKGTAGARSTALALIAFQAARNALPVDTSGIVAAASEVFDEDTKNSRHGSGVAFA